MLNRFFSRIDPISDINILSKKVCENYSLGFLESTKIIETGYEDFNAVLQTETGKYVMKIFKNSRCDNDAMECVWRTRAAENAGVPTPKVFTNKNGEYLSILNIESKSGNSRFRLALIEHIDGMDYFALKKSPSDSELNEIVDIAYKLNQVSYKSSFLYDPWAISSFLKEYDNKWMYLSQENLSKIKPIRDSFKGFDYDSLPKSFVHGDMMSTNLVRDSSGKIWLIDFSVANYTVRINEIIVICGSMAPILGDKTITKKRQKQAFELWCNKVNAISDEKKSFNLLLSVANSINILLPSYEISIGNNSSENKMHLELGLYGLSLIE